MLQTSSIAYGESKRKPSLEGGWLRKQTEG